MKVVLHEPAAWYLLTGDGRLYVDVNCAQSVVSFSILIQLDDAEQEELRALGRVFLDYFAAKVSYWPRRYQPRAITGPLEVRASEAIAAWREADDLEM